MHVRSCSGGIYTVRLYPVILVTVYKRNGQFRTQGVLSDKHGDKAKVVNFYASYRFRIVT